MKSVLSKQGRIEIRRFGTFYIQKHAGRPARNPKTGALVHLPAQYVVKFKPGQPLSQRINLKNK